MEDKHLYKSKRFDNGEWVVGRLLRISATLKFGANESEPIISHGIEYDNGYYSIFDDTLCRCTGEKDRNGKLIFEGDIMQNDDGAICFVRFCEYEDDYGDKHCGFNLFFETFKDVAPLSIIKECEYKITGNIHDNVKGAFAPINNDNSWYRNNNQGDKTRKD